MHWNIHSTVNHLSIFILHRALDHTSVDVGRVFCPAQVVLSRVMVGWRRTPYPYHSVIRFVYKFSHYRGSRVLVHAAERHNHSAIAPQGDAQRSSPLRNYAFALPIFGVIEGSTQYNCRMSPGGSTLLIANFLLCCIWVELGYRIADSGAACVLKTVISCSRWSRLFLPFGCNVNRNRFNVKNA